MSRCLLIPIVLAATSLTLSSCAALLGVRESPAWISAHQVSTGDFKHLHVAVLPPMFAPTIKPDTRISVAFQKALKSKLYIFGLRKPEVVSDWPVNSDGAINRPEFPATSDQIREVGQQLGYGMVVAITVYQYSIGEPGVPPIVTATLDFVDTQQADRKWHVTKTWAGSASNIRSLEDVLDVSFTDDFYETQELLSGGFHFFSRKSTTILSDEPDVRLSADKEVSSEWTTATISVTAAVPIRNIKLRNLSDSAAVGTSTGFGDKGPRFIVDTPKVSLVRGRNVLQVEVDVGAAQPTAKRITVVRKDAGPTIWVLAIAAPSPSKPVIDSPSGRSTQSLQDYFTRELSIPATQIRMLVNEQATLRNIRIALDWLSLNVNSSDLVVIYCGGQVISTEGGTAVMSVADTDPKLPSTALAANELSLPNKGVRTVQIYEFYADAVSQGGSNPVGDESDSKALPPGLLIFASNLSPEFVVTYSRIEDGSSLGQSIVEALRQTRMTAAKGETTGALLNQALSQKHWSLVSEVEPGTVLRLAGLAVSRSYPSSSSFGQTASAGQLTDLDVEFVACVSSGKAALVEAEATLEAARGDGAGSGRWRFRMQSEQPSDKLSPIGYRIEVPTRESSQGELLKQRLQDIVGKRQYTIASMPASSDNAPEALSGQTQITVYFCPPPLEEGSSQSEADAAIDFSTTVGVVVGSDDTLNGAKGNLRGTRRAGLPDPRIFHHNGRYVSVILTENRATANEYLKQSIDMVRTDSYVARIAQWCPRALAKQDYVECEDTR